MGVSEGRAAFLGIFERGGEWKEGKKAATFRRVTLRRGYFSASRTRRALALRPRKARIYKVPYL